MRRTWIDEFSGGSVLVIAGGMLLAVAGIAATASQPVLPDLEIALAFGALIAVGELVRVNLPGDRSAAPLGAAGALAYALLGDFHTAGATSPPPMGCFRSWPSPRSRSWWARYRTWRSGSRLALSHSPGAS